MAAKVSSERKSSPSRMKPPSQSSTALPRDSPAPLEGHEKDGRTDPGSLTAAQKDKITRDSGHQTIETILSNGRPVSALPSSVTNDENRYDRPHTSTRNRVLFDPTPHPNRNITGLNRPIGLSRRWSSYPLLRTASLSAATAMKSIDDTHKSKRSSETLVPSRLPRQSTRSVSIPAVIGVGRKARRISVASLIPDGPDSGDSALSEYDFPVEFKALKEERLRRRRTIPGFQKSKSLLGKGATATVKVMARKRHHWGFHREPQSDRCARPPNTAWEGDIKYFAVKKFRRGSEDEDRGNYTKKIKSEYCLTSSLQHPNIIQTFCLCCDPHRISRRRSETFSHCLYRAFSKKDSDKDYDTPPLSYVMELCVHGDLFHLISKDYLTKTDNLCFFKQIVRGIAYLHSRGIAHRDIKPENLLLTGNGHVKITDFGVSEVFRGRHPGLKDDKYGRADDSDNGIVRLCPPGICGSMPYIAPEVLALDRPYDPRPLDVWSAGIVFLTLACHGIPWQAADKNISGSNPTYVDFVKGWDEFLYPKAADSASESISECLGETSRQVSEKRVPNCGTLFAILGEMYSPALRRLILSMLHPIPEERFSIQEVKQSPYFRGIECCVADARAEESSPLPREKEVLRLHKHSPPKEWKRIMRYIGHHAFAKAI